ncbi:MAG: gldG [Ferruginibacter sp.]|nr:gldG [Ferruginibacter sp.]
MRLINKILSSKWSLMILILCLLFVNLAASRWHARVDLTNEHRFTLSNATINVLKKIDAPLTIDVFLKGDYPSGFKKLGAATTDLLQEFKEIAGPKLKYNVISPEETVPNSNVVYGDTLSAMGLYPINLTSQVKEGQQQQFVYPVALVHYKEQTIPVTLYQGKTPLINFQELNSAEAMLEYQFADAIAKASRTEKPMLAYAIGNGEPMEMTTYDLVENTLKADYQLFTFDPNKQPFVPAEFKVLMIVKPTTGFSEHAKLKLDQFVMNGGKLLVFADRLNAEMDSLKIKNEVVAYDRDLQINDLLFRYGARINPDLVMDLQCDFLPFDVNGNGQFELLPWNYFPVLEGTATNPVTKNIGFVAGRFVNSVDTIEAEGIRKTVLLHSSANARTIGTPALISGKENVNAAEDEKFRTANIPVALLLEGKFRSLYANRLSKEMNDSLTKYEAGFLPNCLTDNKIIIVADGDIVLNSALKNQPIPMGMNPYTFGTQKEFPFANKTFLQNCLEYLVNENGLSEAKSKDYTIRLLDTKKVNDNKLFWQVINIAAPVLLVLLFAFIFQWRRARKYQTKII